MNATFQFVSAFFMLARYDCSNRKSGMGGNERVRGRGRMMSLGMVESDEATEPEREWGGDIVSTSAGIFFEAAVDGLMSYLGSGSLLMLTDWIAEAISAAGLDAMLVESNSEG